MSAPSALRPRADARRRLHPAFWLVTVLSLLAVAYVVFAYAFQPLGKVVTPTMRAVYESHRLGIYSHIFAAMFAMALGPLQFMTGLRARWPRLHRWVGRLYLAGVVVGGVAGLYMAFYSVGGLGAQAGFGTLAVVWLASAWLAWRAIRSGQIERHRRWMLRNFALTFAGVTLRALLIGGFASGLPFEVFYPLIAWLCWVPNALVAEWLLRRGRGPGWIGHAAPVGARAGHAA